jgi:hypothetical protein
MDCQDYDLLLSDSESKLYIQSNRSDPMKRYYAVIILMAGSTHLPQSLLAQLSC